MPQQITEIRQFLVLARRKDAREVKIYKVSGLTKFKIRCSRYLYTLIVAEKDKADKLVLSLPPALKKNEIKGRRTRVIQVQGKKKWTVKVFFNDQWEAGELNQRIEVHVRRHVCVLKWIFIHNG